MIFFFSKANLFIEMQEKQKEEENQEKCDHDIIEQDGYKTCQLCGVVLEQIFKTISNDGFSFLEDTTQKKILYNRIKTIKNYFISFLADANYNGLPEETLKLLNHELRNRSKDQLKLKQIEQYLNKKKVDLQLSFKIINYIKRGKVPNLETINEIPFKRFCRKMFKKIYNNELKPQLKKRVILQEMQKLNIDKKYYFEVYNRLKDKNIFIFTINQQKQIFDFCESFIKNYSTTIKNFNHRALLYNIVIKLFNIKLDSMIGKMDTRIIERYQLLVNAL